MIETTASRLFRYNVPRLMSATGRLWHQVMKRLLRKVYGQFFKNMEVDLDTGCLGKHSKKRFPTYPYIGSKYGNAKKILFVGIDIGKDPQLGHIQSFSERRASIEDKPLSHHNPHIAGTYVTALYFLKDELDWNAHWEKIKDARTCQRALRYQHNDLPPDNPLSYCALTNHYKFVTKSRTRRRGKEDQHYLNESAEKAFFSMELKAFDADIIVFQSSEFSYDITNLNKTKARSYLAPHPTYCPEKNCRNPENYLSKFTLLN